MNNAPVFPYIFRISETGSERFDRYRYRTALTGGRHANFMKDRAKNKVYWRIVLSTPARRRYGVAGRI